MYHCSGLPANYNKSQYYWTDNKYFGISEIIVSLCVSPISRHKWVQNIALGKFVVYQCEHWKCEELYVISQNSGFIHAVKYIGDISKWDPLECMQLGTTGLELFGM
jgi:hypothetical protein